MGEYVMVPRAELVRLQENMDPHRGAGAWGIVCDLLAKQAEQHQGEPVAWMDPRSPQMHATISNEVKQHNVKFGGAPASAVNGYTIPLYTNAGPGEVERLEAELANLRKLHDSTCAQLTERDALLEDLKGKTILSWADKHRIGAALERKP